MRKFWLTYNLGSPQSKFRCRGFAVYLWTKGNPFVAYSRVNERWVFLLDLRRWRWQKFGGPPFPQRGSDA